MNKNLTFAVLLTLVCFSSAYAKTMHAFVGADTASTVKDSCKIDRDRMEKALHGIATACQMKLKLTTLGGKKLTPNAMNRWLKKMRPGKEDVVLFYYAGHGNHKGSKKNLWPAMFLSHKKSYFPLKKVIKKLKKKKQKLALVLCDCCNSAIESSMSLQATHHSHQLAIKFLEIKGIQTLFNETQGLIVASGSVPGSRAWSTTQGGLFTHAFLYCLQHEVLNPQPSWKHLFDETIDLCQGLQTPQAKLSIKQT